MGRLGDDNRVDQVVEALQRTDPAVADGLAMCTRPEPEPALEVTRRPRGHAVGLVRHAVSGPLRGSYCSAPEQRPGRMPIIDSVSLIQVCAPCPCLSLPGPLRR